MRDLSYSVCNQCGTNTQLFRPVWVEVNAEGGCDTFGEIVDNVDGSMSHCGECDSDCVEVTRAEFEAAA